ncbi:DUF4837 family protein [Fulvivirga sedimenti]|uniref:DUF4837 family protein n=1 Tax=Fulvivirga sedimenti TaxID=2879465 RepID=A0A9X1HX47_9BACT|nr:DUF4837 family protein [Fulvivirga sedimenti]MCA6078074.1 DUF4837 family protein [Fulvivirga sedimenti]
MNRLGQLLFLSISLFLFSCGGNGKPSKAMLPPASGRPGEMIIVMDSTQWSGELGETLRGTFAADVPGLPRDEAMFKMNRVEPSKMTRILKMVKNLVFVVTLDSESAASRRIRSYFTAESLERIKNEPELFVFTAEDEFANGQQVMYLFGQTEEQLISSIRENAGNLRGFFNQAEEKRLENTIFTGRNTLGLTKTLQEQYNCTMNFPFGFQVAHTYKSPEGSRGFIWFRQMNPENDKNVFVTYVPYRSESMFSQENLIAFRDSVAINQLFGDPDRPESFVLTETTVPYIPVTTQQLTFKGKFAVKMRGLWKTNNISMGGPFVSYAMVDENTGRFYYIEGFVYSPGKPQREYMRELQVILNSFQTTEMMKEQESSTE